MRLPPLSADRAASLVRRFAGLRILVVGDVMLDRFVVGAVTRISPEAPVPVVRFGSEYVRAGGAANVAHNVAALGGRATLVGVVGADRAADQLRQALAETGVAVDGLVCDAARRTTEKVRVVTERNQQVARIDYESDVEITGDIERRVIADIQRHAPRARAIVVSDYLKGTVTNAVVQAAIAAADRTIPVLVDPKVPHLTYYAGATVITPNHHEAEVATHRRVRTHDEAREGARVFRERARCDSVLMTRGDQGMWLLSNEAEGYLPSVAREVADVTGAGDTVIATLALALAAGASLAESARLANEAAGIVVGKFGPATVTVPELVAAFDSATTS